MKKRIIALLLSITLLLVAVIPHVSAAIINNFTVKVSNTTATAGDSQVAVDILLENNPGIAGFSFCVNYDAEKLVLVESKLNIEDGYKVVAQPTGYGVNLAWTGPSGYSEDGKIATLYFNIPKDLTTSEANIDIVYRAGYDSFYDSHEHDIAVQSVSGKVSIAALQETEKPSVNIGGVSANFGATDIVVPITVKNNPGFSGFSFCVNYDTSRLVLENTEILLGGGYKVVGHPEGYGVNIAWTSTEGYTEDGTIAKLHFSLKDDSNSGKAYINAAFRKGYDSFYSFVNGTEVDISFDSFNGYVNINNHQFGEWVVTLPATCTATGLKTRTCVDCSKSETVIIPKIEHEYVAIVTPPTCTAKGYTTHTCKTCPDYYIDTYVDMVDHILGEWEQNTDLEGEVKGEEIQKCTVCKAIINTRPKANVETYGNLTYTVSNGEATITKCDPSVSGLIVIPSTLGGCPVTSISNDAFYNCSSLTSIEIPSSVTRIGNYAFEGCNSLTTVYYGGTEEEWNEISVDSSNETLLNAEVVFVQKSELEKVLDGTDLTVGKLANENEVVIVPTVVGNVAMTEVELAERLNNEEITIISNNGVIGTGSKIIVGEQEVSLIVKGDIDGDGIVTVFDALMVKKVLANNSFTENDIREFAGDIDGAGVIDTSDVDAILSHIVGEEFIA